LEITGLETSKCRKQVLETELSVLGIAAATDSLVKIQMGAFGSGFGLNQTRFRNDKGLPTSTFQNKFFRSGGKFK